MRNVLLLLTISAVLVAQDEGRRGIVYLKNGNKFEGIIRELGTQVFVEIPNLGSMNFPKDSVAKIEDNGAKALSGNKHAEDAGGRSADYQGRTIYFRDADPKDIQKLGVDSFVDAEGILQLSAKQIEKWMQSTHISTLQRQEQLKKISGKLVKWQGTFVFARRENGKNGIPYYFTYLCDVTTNSQMQVHFSEDGGQKLREAAQGDTVTYVAEINSYSVSGLEILINGKVLAISRAPAKPITNKRYRDAAEIRKLKEFIEQARDSDERRRLQKQLDEWNRRNLEIERAKKD